MTELDKELRLAAIETWKQSLLLDRQELESVHMDMKVLESKAAVLVTKERLYGTRIQLALIALEQLGVRAL
jgi:hypothetical protein